MSFSFFSFHPPSCFLTVSVANPWEGWFSISSSVIKAQSHTSQYWFEHVLLKRKYNCKNPHSTVIQVQPCRKKKKKRKQGCVLLVNPVFTRKEDPRNETRCLHVPEQWGTVHRLSWEDVGRQQAGSRRWPHSMGVPGVHPTLNPIHSPSLQQSQ